MQYSKDKEWVRDVLKSADITSVINGGMAEPQVEITQQTGQYLLSVFVPSVDPREFDVEIVDKKVVVNHWLQFKQENEWVEFPKVVAAFPITPNIDYRNITARKAKNKLEVVMPFNELESDYRQHIEIKF